MFFGLGAQEILLLAVLGILMFVGVAIAVVTVLALSRRSRGGGPNEMAALRAENAALRREIENLKAEASPPEVADNPTGIRQPR